MLTFSLPGALGMDRTQKPNKRLPQGKTFGLEFNPGLLNYQAIKHKKTKDSKKTNRLSYLC